MPMINISLLWKFKPPRSDSRKPANPKKNLASILNHSNGPFVFYGLVEFDVDEDGDGSVVEMGCVDAGGLVARDADLGVF